MSLLDVFRPDVLAMHAYHVQDAAGFIKLDAMENPFALPPELQAKLGERLGHVALNRYPGTRINDLHAALRAHAGVPADMGRAGEGGPPNAKAGRPGLVIIDEAYQPCASQSWRDRLPAHPHVLLMRTLSKFGLAGVRLSYMMGRADLIEQVEKVRPPYNISVLNTEAALFALEHEGEFTRQATLIKSERERLMAALATMPGAKAYPSEANMILVRVNDAAGTFAALKARGILIKNVSGLHQLLANCVRLTVGAPAENDALIAALSEILRDPLHPLQA